MGLRSFLAATSIAALAFQAPLIGPTDRPATEKLVRSFVVALLGAQEVRPTIIAKPSGPPGRNFVVIYYDDAFLFGGRHYGNAADAGGNTEHQNHCGQHQ